MTDERDAALQERDAIRNDLSEKNPLVCLFGGRIK